MAIGVSRAAVSAWLLLAVVMKLRHPRDFRNFLRDLGLPEGSITSVFFGATLLAELSVAGLLLFGRNTIAGIAASLLFFSFSAILLRSFHLNVRCGCLGRETAAKRSALYQIPSRIIVGLAAAALALSGLGPTAPGASVLSAAGLIAGLLPFFISMGRSRLRLPRREHPLRQGELSADGASLLKPASHVVGSSTAGAISRRDVLWKGLAAAASALAVPFAGTAYGRWYTARGCPIQCPPGSTKVLLLSFRPMYVLSGGRTRPAAASPPVSGT